MKKLLFTILCLAYGMDSLTAQPAEVPFNGLITDASGKGIKARIDVKNSEKYTVADRKGQFGLTDIAPTDTLTVRYRRTTHEIPVAGRHSLKIVWLDDNPTCDEDEQLVDFGFGYVNRREYTSSSTGLTGSEILRKGFTDLQSAILALVPGVQLINGEIVIRGISSINSSSAALLICDGSELRDLNTINIYDVKSVEVLKGSNMYGLRGGNGVIVIRTRSK